MKGSGRHIAGVILAAGSSTRMGKTKQLLPFDRTTLLGRVVQTARASALNEIIVVLGHCAEKIRHTLDFSNTTVILNPDYAKGQSTSLIAGLRQVPAHCDAAMFLLGDQPLVTPEVINRLIRAFENNPELIVIPYYQKKRGNPVIIARSLFDRLLSLSSDAGARVIFDEFKHTILKVPVTDKAILFDVDTKKDYDALMSKK